MTSSAGRLRSLGKALGQVFLLALLFFPALASGQQPAVVADRALVKKIAPHSEERYDYITERFGEENMTRLYELLGELIECMEEDEPVAGE